MAVAREVGPDQQVSRQERRRREFSTGIQTLESVINLLIRGSVGVPLKQKRNLLLLQMLV